MGRNLRHIMVKPRRFNLTWFIYIIVTAHIILLLVMFFFPWPPARAVWPNYEVVLLPPWSGTASSLSSVTNITFYLNPALPLTCLLDSFPSPSVA